MKFAYILLISLLFSYGQTLLCYRCRKCDDRFPANWTQIVNCSSSCIKEVLYIHEKSRVLRHCGDRIPARELLKGSNEIINNEMRYYNASYAGAHLYSCKTDLCNESPVSMPTTLLIGFIIFWLTYLPNFFYE